MSPSEAASPKRLLRASEAAKLAGMSRTKFYQLIKVLPPDVIAPRPDGCEMLFRRAALLRWLDGAAS